MNHEDDDLEPFYNGYASEQEIEQQLAEITKSERDKVLNQTPAEVIPAIQSDSVLDERAVQIAAQGELFRQRAIDKETTNPTSTAEFFTEPEATTEPVAENEIVTEPITEPVKPLPTEPDEVFTDYQAAITPAPAAQAPSEPESGTYIRINPANNELKRQKALAKKVLLAQDNLERYLQRYFIETASCFMLNRNVYKDKYGIAPYNKFATNKTTQLPEYSMSATKGRLYKFCTYLIDVERFLTHPNLYNDFITAIERGVPLARISETLHPIYRKKYKNDFILNLSNREDWDNVIILVYNNYILNNDNFKDVFTRVPFEIPVAYNEQNISDYLSDLDVQERFADRYSALLEIGIPTIWEALFICFVNSIKQKLSIEQLENAILKDYKKIVRNLKRADIQRNKLKRAS